MSVTPAVTDTDLRPTPARTAAQESRHASEAKFQDAVDSRRAERSRTDAKREHGPREQSVERERSSDVPNADRPDAPDRAEAQDDAEVASSEPTDRAEPRDSTTARSRETEPAATGEDATPPRALRAAREANPIASAARSDEPSPTAFALPIFGQAALEALLAGALHHGPIPGSSNLPSGSISSAVPDTTAANAAPHGAPRGAGSAQQLPAASKASAAAASTIIGTDGSGVSKPPSRDGETPVRATPNAATTALDPRSALAAFAAPASADAQAARAPVMERVTPAELPAFLERLAVRIDAPERSAVVHLEPAELGPLRIALSVEPGGHVRAELHAQRPDGYAALEARLPELQASLIGRGFTSATLNLSLGHADSQARQSRAHGETRNSSSAGRRTLADAEVRALSPAALGAIDLWA
jgi:flagellar hook-length control protein FliK